jgi:uncharacterized protein (DUF1778 family)
MNLSTKSPVMLTATISFRLTEDECRTLAACADHEQGQSRNSFASCYGTCSSSTPRR